MYKRILVYMCAFVGAIIVCVYIRTYIHMIDERIMHHVEFIKSHLAWKMEAAISVKRWYLPIGLHAVHREMEPVGSSETIVSSCCTTRCDVSRL